MGLQDLISPEDSNATHALSRRAFMEVFDQVKPILQRGLPRDCSFIYSAAVHRVRPRHLKLSPHSHLKIAVSSELVSVRITGQGPDRYPKIENFIDPQLAKGQLLLPLDNVKGPNPDQQRVEQLRSVVFASMALPGLLEPQVIKHCVYDRSTTQCTDETSREATFVDGGLLNNRPLGTALRLAQSGLKPITASDTALKRGQMQRAQMQRPQMQRPQISRQEPIPDRELPEQARFLLIDPSIDAYPAIPPTQPDQDVNSSRITSVTQLIGETFKSFFTVARSAELLGAFERHPQLERQLITGVSHYPMFSDLLSGFFDQELREFDFYLGMYDSSRAFRERAWTQALPSLKSLTAPEQAIMSASASPQLKAAWRPMICIRAYLETQLKTQLKTELRTSLKTSDSVTPAECLNTNARMRNFKILSQVSLDRLYHHCSLIREARDQDETSARAQRSPQGDEHTSHTYCDAILRGEPPRTIKGLPILKPQERRPLAGEPGLKYVFRLLARYQYEFKSLKLSPEQSDQAFALFIAQLHKLADLFASRQDAVTSLMMKTMSQTALNQLAYVAPKHQLHLNIGYQVEGGWSQRLTTGGLFRGGAVLELEGVTSPLNPTPNFLAVIPQLALLSDFSLTQSDLLRGQLGVRGGYQLSTADRFATQSCEVDSELSYMCSRPLLQGVATLRVANRLRFQLALVWGPELNGMRSFVQVSPSVGLEWNSF